MRLESAEIIAVGTELLLGQTLNSNACFLAQALSALGLNSYHQQVVGDHRKRLGEALGLALSRADLIVFSGGLGPTEDDLTVAAAAAYIGLPLVESAEARAHIEHYFARFRRPISSNNYKQALIPDGAQVLLNDHGTAPGLLLDCVWQGQAKTLVFLPGPPKELEGLWPRVAEILQTRTAARFRHRYLHFVGIGESALVTLLADLIAAQDTVTIAPYAQEGMVMLRVSQRLQEPTDEDRTEPVVREIVARCAAYFTHEGPESLAAYLLKTLAAAGEQLVLAESLSGGLAGALLTAIPGASSVLVADYVVYANAAKEKLLGVSAALLDRYHAVSAECAAAMVDGAARDFPQATILALTGVAGPGPDSDGQPAGLVYLGLRCRGQNFGPFELQLSGDRQRVRRAAVLRGFQKILDVLKIVDE